MRPLLWTCAAAALVAFAGCPRPAPPTALLAESGPTDPYLGHLAWMAGSWVSIDEDTIVEEHWTTPRGGMIVGVSRTTVGGRVTFWEYVQIVEEDDRVVFRPWPKGVEGVPFYQYDAESTRPGQMRAVFENPNNDFPQRIEYRRIGDVLEAIIRGEIDGKARSESWRWQRIQIDQ